MKLYRLRYSPYAVKVQMVLDLLPAHYEIVDVPYGKRDELAALTGGYIQVPVLVDDTGAVTVESRAICEKLLAGPAGKRLVPAPLEGPIWAYADFADNVLEDVMFRLASPAIRDTWTNPFERALYVFVKERKFGAGCVDAWQKDAEQLVRRTQHLLAPTLSTLEQSPFLFGAFPTLADAALYGECRMIEEGDKEFLPRIAPALPPYLRRLERFATELKAKARLG
ncbi:MAG TPA: glutathione S-transferase family protein [Polyangiaceae bacterium]|nr:glutathione S-transferase family protein [Polyangiaceae bacterium]